MSATAACSHSTLVQWVSWFIINVFTPTLLLLQLVVELLPNWRGNFGLTTVRCHHDNFLLLLRYFLGTLVLLLVLITVRCGIVCKEGCVGSDDRTRWSEQRTSAAQFVLHEPIPTLSLLLDWTLKLVRGGGAILACCSWSLFLVHLAEHWSRHHGGFIHRGSLLFVPLEMEQVLLLSLQLLLLLLLSYFAGLFLVALSQSRFVLDVGPCRETSLNRHHSITAIDVTAMVAAMVLVAMDHETCFCHFQLTDETVALLLDSQRFHNVASASSITSALSHLY